MILFSGSESLRATVQGRFVPLQNISCASRSWSWCVCHLPPSRAAPGRVGSADRATPAFVTSPGAAGALLLPAAVSGQLRAPGFRSSFPAGLQQILGLEWIFFQGGDEFLHGRGISHHNFVGYFFFFSGWVGMDFWCFPTILLWDLGFFFHPVQITGCTQRAGWARTCGPTISCSTTTLSRTSGCPWLPCPPPATPPPPS